MSQLFDSRAKVLEYEAKQRLVEKEIELAKLQDLPPRKPLTDEEILKRYDEYVVEQQNVIAFARAIEAAHGIKEKP